MHLSQYCAGNIAAANRDIFTGTIACGKTVCLGPGEKQNFVDVCGWVNTAPKNLPRQKCLPGLENQVTVTSP